MSAKLDEGVTPVAATADQPLVFNAAQVAALLNVHRATVFDLIGRGELRSFQIGRRRLISRRAIDEFIAQREAQSGS